MAQSNNRADPADHRAAQEALRALANPNQAKILQRFFKTGPGEYGEGDHFLGIKVPVVRQCVRTFRQLPLIECTRLLASPYNEERLLALLILVGQYQKGDEATRAAIYRLYLKHRSHVNNWNLVDSSAPHIVGVHLLSRDRQPLDDLAASRSLWDRRIAVVATQALIRAREFRDTLRLAERLLTDPHDLMHKACGWMLREVGERDQSVLEEFLRQHQRTMPRTMLRYAIEKFSPARRQAYLQGCG